MLKNICSVILSSIALLSCNKQTKTINWNESGPITGTLLELVSSNLSLSSCEDGTQNSVSLYKFNRNFEQTLVATGTLNDSGSFEISEKDLVGVKIKSNDERFLLVADLCNGEVRQRILSGRQQQEVNSGTTLLANAAITKNTLFEAPLESWEEVHNIIGNGKDDFEDAIKGFSQQNSLSTLINKIVKIEKSEIPNLPPIIRSFQFPDKLEEGKTYALKVNLFSWSSDYTPAIAWKLDGKIIGTSNSFNYKLDGKSQGSRVLSVAVGQRGANGALNESALFDKRAKTYSVDNTLIPTGTIACSSEHYIGKSGEPYTLSCSGAVDADGEELAYKITNPSGVCPTSTGSNAFSTIGTCALKVKACDITDSCTSESSAFKISSYTLATSLDTPTLNNSCLLNFLGGISHSNNISSLSYFGSVGMSGLSPSATDGGLSYIFTSQPAVGNYNASWGVANGIISGERSSLVFGSSSVPWTLSKAFVGVLAKATPTLGAMSTGHQGDQASSATTSASCTLCDSQSPGLVASGWGTTCVLKPSATGMTCWGANGSSIILGDGTTGNKSYPVQNPNITDDIAQFALGQNTNCYLTKQGKVMCWGSNGFGGVGDGTLVDKSTPTQIFAAGSGVVALTRSQRYNTCAIFSDGTAQCWGNNQAGELAIGSTGVQSSPVEFNDNLTNLPLTGIVSGTQGQYHTCMLLSNNTVKCAGANHSGQLGDGTFNNRLKAVNTLVVNDAVAISSGWNHTCALRTGGNVKCWGNGSFGQLGDGTTNHATSPVDVSGLSGVVAVSLGMDHSCAILNDATVKCWGKNTSGQLGDGTLVDRSLPTAVPGLANVVAIAPGTNHTCALIADGTVKCWGANDSGQLGNGTYTDSTTPVTVVGVNNTGTLNARAHSCYKYTTP